MSNGFVARWEPLVLYLVFVPTKDRLQQDIPEEFLGSVLRELRQKMSNDEGGPKGLTEVQFMGRGETAAWGKENTLLLFAIGTTSSVEAVEPFFEKLGAWVKTQLNQASVLIIKWINSDAKALSVSDQPG